MPSPVARHSAIWREVAEIALPLELVLVELSYHALLPSTRPPVVRGHHPGVLEECGQIILACTVQTAWIIQEKIWHGSRFPEADIKQPDQLE